MQVLFWFFLKIRLNMVWFMVSDGYTDEEKQSRYRQKRYN
jgi:hypothetical protein